MSVWRRGGLCLLGLLWAMLPRAGVAAPFPGQDGVAHNIQSLIQLNPDFSTYPGFDGVVWLKHFDYRTAPEGGLERTSTWILLGRKGLDPRWLTWSVPVSSGGKVEFLEASAYSSKSAQKVAEAALSGPDAPLRSASFTDLPEEFILVVVYRELFPDRLSVGDFVWIGESLPVWETRVTATVPDGISFFQTAEPLLEPKVSKDESTGFVLYEWRAINTPGEARFSLRSSERDYLAFGIRDGRDAAARFLKNIEKRPVPALSAAARDLQGKKGSSRRVGSFLNWLYAQPTVDLPEGSPRAVPEQAPWTRSEKVLLAQRWLKENGFDVRLLWRLPYTPDAGRPAFELAALTPVLAIPDGQKGFFHTALDAAPVVGENALSLWGRTLYAVEANGRIEGRKVAAPSAGENRLTLVYDLRVNKDGVKSGTVKIQARNAWDRLLFSVDPSEEEQKRMVRGMFPELASYAGVAFRRAKHGGELHVTLKETQMIKGTQGRNVMVSWPSFIPGRLAELAALKPPFALRFPFLLDVRIVLALPEVTDSVIPQQAVERGAGKIRYSDSVKVSRKNVLTAEARLLAAVSGVSENDGADLKTALQSWHAFMTRNVAVRFKTAP